MNKILYSLLTALLIATSQLPISTAAHADSTDAADTNAVIGFVFQDNDNNGIFDESDNTFASATVYIQKAGSDTVQEVSANSAGYFEIDGLSEGTYDAWAIHYYSKSTIQVVELNGEKNRAVLTLAIENLLMPVLDSMNPSESLERTTDSQIESILLPLIVG